MTHLEELDDLDLRFPMSQLMCNPCMPQNLSTGIQTHWQKIIDHLPTGHGQRSYLLKLRYKITDEILAQKSWPWKLYLRSISPKPMHWSMPQLGHYRRVLGKEVLISNFPQCLAAGAEKEDQAIVIRCQKTQWNG